MLPNNFPLRASVFAVLSLGSALSTVRADDILPQPLPTDRYSAMSDRSPFALATVAAPAAAAPEASFATNWFITGVGRLNDEDYVTIKARDLSTQFSIYGRESVNGVGLASVNWSEAIGKTTVILRKGTETAKLEFNEAEVRSAPTASPPPRASGSPGAPAVGQPLNAGANPPHPVIDPRAPNPRGIVSPPGGLKVIRPGAPNTMSPPNGSAPPPPSAAGAASSAQQNIRRRPMPINPPH